MLFKSTRAAPGAVDIIKYDLYRGPNIGVYACANDSTVFMPNGFAEAKAAALADHLGANPVNVSLGNTRVIGILAILNNNGALLPRTAEPEEEKLFKEAGINTAILDAKHNALGNLIAANDTGAVVSPLIPKEELGTVRDVLGVEVIQKRIAGYNQVGSVMRANNHGGIIHPEADRDTISEVGSVLGAEVEPATINGGVPFVASGSVANNKAVIVGSFTTGPEIMMLTRAFAQDGAQF